MSRYVAHRSHVPSRVYEEIVYWCYTVKVQYFSISLYEIPGRCKSKLHNTIIPGYKKPKIWTTSTQA